MRTGAAVLALLSLGCLLSGCTREQASVVSPSPTAAPSESRPMVTARPRTSGPAAPRSRTASPIPSGFSDAYVSQCNGRPSGEQVVAAIRRSRPNLPGGSGVTVKAAPLCAGIWQFTVLNVADSEPLQVVTKGQPAALTVVTAGTDPCTIEVTATAPRALVDAAGC